MVQTYSKKDGNVKLSKNFRAGEFACKCSCCTEFLLDDALVDWLQRIRDHFGVSVNVNSGYRCPAHNAEVGGSTSSHHKKGMAADIRVSGIKPEEVARFAETAGIQRIGLYDSFVHIGSAATKRFWKGHEGIKVDTFCEEACFSVELPVLKRGSRGEAVRSLQAHLMGLGYSCGKSGADGSFGAATETAVKQFQADHTLTQNGIADVDTRAAMLGVTAGDK